jgi:glycosyltransferase involved in cell wall biosynthesis
VNDYKDSDSLRNNDPISCLIPTRNSVQIIEQTLDTLVEFLAKKTGSEILVLENGSTDGTKEYIHQLLEVKQYEIPVKLLSAFNYGNAVRLGFEFAKNQRIVLTADDLPYELQDWNAFDYSRSQLSIGAKSLEDSIQVRSFLRRLMTRVFFFIRSKLLGLGEEVNGTLQFLQKGPEIVGLTSESGLSLTLEIVYLARQNHLTFSELGVDYIEKSHPSRVRIFRDSFQILTLIVRLRLTKGKITKQN